MERARIVLLAADGLTGPQIAERAGCTEPTVVKWRRQYAEAGLAGLEDAPRPGGPKTVLTDAVVWEILAATVTPVGAENLCHQAIFVDDAARGVTPPHAELIQIGDAIGRGRIGAA